MTKTTASSIKRRALSWTWASRVLLIGLAGLAASELFVFPGALFRLATPAAAYAIPDPPQLPPKQPSEGESASTDAQTQQRPFDPTDPSSVPEARLPKELATSEMQALIKDVEKLMADLQRLADDAPEYAKDHALIDTADVRERLWRKLVTKGFENTETPGLWYRVAGSRAGTIEYVALEAIALPVGHVKARILGGVATTADAAYIFGVQSWLEPHLQWLDEKQKTMDKLKQLIHQEGINP